MASIKFIEYYEKYLIGDIDAMIEKADEKSGRKSGRKHQYDVILNYIIENNKVTTATVMELLNLGKSRVVVILSEMIEKRLIKRVGQGTATYYTK